MCSSLCICFSVNGTILYSGIWNSSLVLSSPSLPTFNIICLFSSSPFTWPCLWSGLSSLLDYLVAWLPQHYSLPLHFSSISKVTSFWIPNLTIAFPCLNQTFPLCLHETSTLQHDLQVFWGPQQPEQPHVLPFHEGSKSALFAASP